MRSGSPEWYRFVRRLPDRDSDGLRAGASGQTLNKPRRRKPRNAAARFGWGTAYGDLMLATLDEGAVARERRRRA